MQKRRTRFLVIALGIIISILIVGFIYVKTITYQPTTQALDISKNAELKNDTLVFEGEKDRPALIFYQGALVENTSYSIWAQKVADAGYTVYLAKEPFNLAVLGQNKAEKIIEANQVTDYVIGGHSLGGVMASRFAAAHEDQDSLKGVFFLASYPDEKGSLANFNGQVLSLTGSNDGVLNWDAYEQAKEYLPKQTVFEEIKGGNHAGFGSYGEQKGDDSAAINNDEQQSEVAEKLIQWLNTIE